MVDHTNQLGKYELLEELGKGSFASVQLAMDSTLGREVALMGKPTAESTRGRRRDDRPGVAHARRTFCVSIARFASGEVEKRSRTRLARRSS